MPIFHALSSFRKKTLKITAYAVREVFDSKAAIKDLLFFSTGERMRELSHVWVAVEKGGVITADYLWSEKAGSAERKIVEDMLKSNKCSPLTLAQKTADWFLFKLYGRYLSM